jgi:putative Holliday junction resolvase
LSAGASGSILAFDFGAKRIGVALADRAIGVAHPLAAITFEDNRRRFEAIAGLIDTWQPVLLIVGDPRADSATHHALAPRIARFVRRLRSRFTLPVELIDETLTSWSASRELSRAGMRAADQRAHIDSLAACLILESWFEERTRTTPLPGSTSG